MIQLLRNHGASLCLLLLFCGCAAHQGAQEANAVKTFDAKDNPQVIVNLSSFTPLSGRVDPGHNARYSAVSINTKEDLHLKALKVHISSSYAFEETPVKSVTLQSMDGKIIAKAEISSDIFRQGYVEFQDIDYLVKAGRRDSVIIRAKLHEESFRSFTTGDPLVYMQIAALQGEDVVLTNSEGIAAFQDLTKVKYTSSDLGKQFVYIRPKR